jgi:hypothetical protein
MSITEKIVELNEEVKTYAQKYETRLKYWIGPSAYKLETMLIVEKLNNLMMLGMYVFVRYWWSRSNSDYEDYQSSAMIPLEYFELSENEYKSYKDNIDFQSKLKEKEKVREGHLQAIRNAEANIKHYQAEVKKYQGYLV